MVTAGATTDLVTSTFYVVTWLGRGEAPWAPLRDLDWLAWRGAAKIQSVKHTADRGLEAALCGASARLNC